MKEILIFVLLSVAIIPVSGKKEYRDSVPNFGKELKNSTFFRDYYHYNDFVHYLDNLNDLVTYQSETTGNFNLPDQLIFSVAGNSHRWNKFYLDGFRTDSRFFAGSTFYQPDLYNHSLEIDYFKSGIYFESDSFIPNSVSATYNVGGIGGVAPGTKEIIHILEQKGIKSLFIEGGTQILTMFLTENAVDYLRVAIAPFFVGETEAPRFTSSGKFPFNKNNRMNLVKVSKVGDMAVMEYDLRHCYDYNMLEKAVELSKKCPKSNSAYSVGAVIVTNKGEIFEGYSRETEPHNHAEEEAILKAEKAGAVLENATIYSSMEPCSTRKSKPISCSEHIIKHKMSKVVFAFYEPDNFVICNAKKILEEAGIEVVIIDELAEKVKEINAHILK